MPIKFTFNREALASMLRFTPEQVEKEMEKYDKDFIYKHMNNGSGICPECAPWLNMRTTGDGSDGVPVPPLHPRCKCFLVPVGVAMLIDHLQGMYLAEDIAAWMKHYEWLRSLSYDRLSAVLGKVRARLVFNGDVKIDDLYEGNRLKTLEEMGFGRNGLPMGSMERAEVFLGSSENMQLMRLFHEHNFEKFPKMIRGTRPGDKRAVTVMVARAIAVIDNGKKIKRPLWLVALVAEVLELDRDGVV